MNRGDGFSLKKRDLIFLAAVLALALAGFLLVRFFAREGNTAVITLDGREIIRLDLTRETDRVFSLEEEYGVPVSFEIQGGQIRFVNVTCPDHICENEGYLSREGQRAVCMPNRVVLSVYGDTNEP